MNFLKILKFNFFIITPSVEAIGNMGEEIYYSLLKAKRERKKVLILFPYDLFYPFYFSKYGLGINSELRKINSKYLLYQCDSWIVFLLNIIFTLYLMFKKIINKILKIIFFQKRNIVTTKPKFGINKLWTNNLNVYDSDIVKKMNWHFQFESRCDVNLSKKSIQIGRKTKSKMGLPSDCFYVVLHVRDSGYYNAVEGYKEGKMKRVRNSDIKNYIKSIKYITDLGWWVVRLGNSKMKKLPKMKNVIDYPFTQFKSNLMDIFLIKDCNLYFGPRSGIADVAILFQKNCITTNQFGNILVSNFKKKDIYIMMKVYSKKLNKILNLNEVLELYKQNIDFFDEDKFKLIENNEEEIYQMTKEYFERKSYLEQTKNQIEWNEKIFQIGKIIIEKTNNLANDPKMNLLKKYRDASTIYGSKGSISEYFYNKYS